MLRDYIYQSIKDALGFKPSEQQDLLLRKLADFVNDSESPKQTFLLRGYAGTGKTSVIAAFVKAMKELKKKTFLIAPTGRAAKVLSKYAGKEAHTIHKRIYRQKSSSDGFGKFVLDANLYSDTIFIVDEASMISDSSGGKSIFGSGRLLSDLINYVFNEKNCKLILSGDTAQLPPVRTSLSPALNKKNLESYGLTLSDMELTHVVRQAHDSGILHNATKIRELIRSFSDKKALPPLPQIEHRNFSDVSPVSGTELIEEISDAYSKYGEQDVIVVCRSNKRANRFNMGIRNTVLYREEELSVGDLLMVVKNNYFWADDYPELEFIANGDIAQVSRIIDYTEQYGLRFADIVLNFPDYGELELEAKIILDTLHIEAPSLTSEQNKEFYLKVEEDFADIRSRRKRFKEIRKHPFFNALQVKYAYAVTCHKAQGGQWGKVFIDQGWLPDNGHDTEYLRWLYTAFTRASKELSLINFKKDFFSTEEQAVYMQ